MDIGLIQDYLRLARIDAWLLYDFRGSNPVLSQLLPGRRHLTRRVFLLVPARGEARLLAQSLDAPSFRDCGVPVEEYRSWADLRGWLAAALAGMGRVAMEYSPGCALPVVGIVDAGTVELVRSLGVEVVSSANVIQAAVAVWSAEAVRQHAIASREVAAAKDSAFALIAARHRAGSVLNEHEVQQHILECFAASGLEWPDPPIVAANEHSGDPHFEVSATHPAPIRPGDWVLIDLWARVPGDENIYSDITWVGFCGESAPEHHRRVFAAVRAARDASLKRAVDGFARGERLQGWQLDEAAASEIRGVGFGEFIKHRTGHSLSPGPKVHGMGMNLDNLETHDTREMLPGLGFTIEPGIYLPEFGVRLEINVHVDPATGPRVTSCLQDEIVHAR